jgi:uncharacterized protein YbjQ (UPF0145 family)
VLCCPECYGDALREYRIQMEEENARVHDAVQKMMVSTTFELPGYQVTHNLGLARGIVVRSRSVLGTVGASLQTLVGGDITLFTQLCEQTRKDAFERMLQHGVQLGANAVVGVRYDATEIAQGVTEVLAYGTAVTVKETSSNGNR